MFRNLSHGRQRHREFGSPSPRSRRSPQPSLSWPHRGASHSQPRLRKDARASCVRERSRLISRSALPSQISHPSSQYRPSQKPRRTGEIEVQRGFVAFGGRTLRSGSASQPERRAANRLVWANGSRLRSRSAAAPPAWDLEGLASVGYAYAYQVQSVTGMAAVKATISMPSAMIAPVTFSEAFSKMSWLFA